MSDQFETFDEVWDTRENEVRDMLRELVNCKFTYPEHKVKATLSYLKAISRNCYVTGSLDGVREAAVTILEQQEKS